jgi:hypothetical protein
MRGRKFFRLQPHVFLKLFVNKATAPPTVPSHCFSAATLPITNKASTLTPLMQSPEQGMSTHLFTAKQQFKWFATKSIPAVCHPVLELVILNEAGSAVKSSSSRSFAIAQDDSCRCRHGIFIAANHLNYYCLTRKNSTNRLRPIQRGCGSWHYKIKVVPGTVDSI